MPSSLRKDKSFLRQKSEVSVLSIYRKMIPREYILPIKKATKTEGVKVAVNIGEMKVINLQVLKPHI